MHVILKKWGKFIANGLSSRDYGISPCYARGLCNSKATEMTCIEGMRSDKERFTIQCLAWRASALCL